jgi:cytochrome c peroxidase
LGARVAACALALAAVAPFQVPGGDDPRKASFELGEDVFFHETFGGNGRTCATCHDPRNEFTMSPALVEARYQQDPAQPLFRAIDSDDGRGNDYTTLREHALFTVTIPLHPNVLVVGHPAQRTITVRRGVPSIANVALTAPYLLDGRAATLPEQAAGAIRDHMRPTRKPSAKELDALKRFQEQLFYPLQIRALALPADPVPLDPGFSIPLLTDAAQRGKASFDLHCRRCHDGEMLDRPADPEASRFNNALVSDVNTLNLPILRLAFKRPDGSFVETATPDPGRAAITGNLDDLNFFDTPQLRGLKRTAPYFHDNSAATLGNVIDHYNGTFLMQIDPQERDDLIAFLETL